MPAIFFALISYIGWGSGDIFGTIATRKIGAYSTTFWSNVIWTVIFSAYIPFALNELSRASFFNISLSIVLGAVGVIGLVLAYEALRIGPVSLVGTIIGSFASLVVVFSIIFLKETVSAQQMISMLLIFTGIILSSLNFKELLGKKLILGRGVVFALLGMILFGIQFTFVKIPVREIGWFWPLYLSSVTFPLLIPFMKYRKIKLSHINYKGTFIPLFFSSILLSIAAYSFNIAISRGLVAIVAPIAGSYPTLFVALAFIFFKDRITKQQILGIATTLIGIVLLSFFSV